MPGSLARLLVAQPAHRSLPSACAALREELGGEVLLWLVDYAQARLRLAASSGPREDEQRVDGSWAGRCFASQQVLRAEEDGTARLHVPVTALGDRVGVLELRTPADRDVDAGTAGALEVAAAQLALGLTEPVTRTADVPEQARRRDQLTVAAELQWSLLPGAAYADDDVTVAGLLEPAYSIAGDCYDWARDPGGFSLAVADGAGRGVPSALTATLAVSALRNARLAGSSLADQAALADQALYAHHGGESFVSALLFRFDVDQRSVTVVEAGSPLVYRLRGQAVDLVRLDAQLPLGMFEETVYVEQRLDVEPGDRLVVVSDGVHGARLQDGSEYGQPRLERGLREARLLPPAELVRHTVRTLQEAVRAGQVDPRLEDDAVVVCLDWHPGGAGGADRGAGGRGGS